MTRITKGNRDRENPARGVTSKEAARILAAIAAGKDVNPSKATAAKKAARDHYATEVDKARRTN